MATRRITSNITSLPKTWRAVETTANCVKNVRLYNDSARYGNEQTIKPFTEIPGPRVLPLIGTSWQYIKQAGGPYDINQLQKAQVDKYHRYGKIVRDKSGTLDMVHLFDPKDVVNMYRHEGKYPSRGDVANILVIYNKRENTKTQYGGDGETWYDTRSKVQAQMLRPASVSYYLDLQDQIADDFIARMRRKLDEKCEIADFNKELFRYTTEAIAAISYDKRLDCFDDVLDPEVERFLEALESIFDILSVTMISFPWYKYMKTPLYKEFAKHWTYVKSLGRRYTDECHEKIQKKIRDNTITDSEPNFIMSLMKRQDLTLEQILATTLGLFFAGVESTAKTSACVLYNLAKNPEKLQKLVEEIDTIVPDHAAVTQQALDKMPYLKACVKESFRLTFPVSFGSVRKLDHEVIMSGYRIPPGVLLMANCAAMCRLDDYFPDPHEFIPERWLRNNQQAMKIDSNTASFIMLPFGYGLRSCLGRRFAEQELYLLIIKVLQNFQLDYKYEDLDTVNSLFTSLEKSPKFTFSTRSR